jgi:hypothetical protein
MLIKIFLKYFSKYGLVVTKLLICSHVKSTLGVSSTFYCSFQMFEKHEMNSKEDSFSV